MDFGNVEAQSSVEAPVAAEVYTPAQQMAVDSQRGAELAAAFATNTAGFALPFVQLVDRSQEASEVSHIGPNLGGRTVELAPPGAPFSMQMFVPDPEGPNLRPDIHGRRTLPRNPNAGGDNIAPNLETAPGDPTEPNMVPNSRRRLPNAEPNIDFDALGDNDAIRSHMTPGKPGEAKPVGKEPSLEAAAREIGEKLKEAAKRERINEILKNFRGHSRKPKV